MQGVGRLEVDGHPVAGRHAGVDQSPGQSGGVGRPTRSKVIEAPPDDQVGRLLPVGGGPWRGAARAASRRPVPGWPPSAARSGGDRPPVDHGPHRIRAAPADPVARVVAHVPPVPPIRLSTPGGPGPRARPGPAPAIARPTGRCTGHCTRPAQPAWPTPDSDPGPGASIATSRRDGSRRRTRRPPHELFARRSPEADRPAGRCGAFVTAGRGDPWRRQPTGAGRVRARVAGARPHAARARTRPTTPSDAVVVHGGRGPHLGPAAPHRRSTDLHAARWAHGHRGGGGRRPPRSAPSTRWPCSEAELGIPRPGRAGADGHRLRGLGPRLPPPAGCGGRGQRASSSRCSGRPAVTPGRRWASPPSPAGGAVEIEVTVAVTRHLRPADDTGPRRARAQAIRRGA